MTSTRIASVAAVAVLVAWGLKALAIWIAGGLDESPLEAPLFVLGLVALAVAGGASGVALAGARPSWAKALAGIAGAVLAVGLMIVVESAVGALVPESAGWVKEEAGLWAAAVLAAAFVLLWLVPRKREAAS